MQSYNSQFFSNFHILTLHSSPMISKNCLTKLGDYRDNKIADEQKNDASFMVAWAELKEIIEFVEETERKNSQKIGHTRLKPKTIAAADKAKGDNSIPDSAEPLKLRNCHVGLQRLTANQLKIMESVSATRGEAAAARIEAHVLNPVQKLGKCRVVLKHMSDEGRNLHEKSATLPNKKPEKIKQNINVVVDGRPLKEISQDPKKISKPTKMMTRSDNKNIELTQKRKNKENQ